MATSPILQSSPLGQFKPTKTPFPPAARTPSPSQLSQRSSSAKGFRSPSPSTSSRPVSLAGSAGRYRAPVSSPPPGGSGSVSPRRPSNIKSEPLPDRTDDLSTPIPDSLKPILRLALKRWKRFHERKVLEHLKERREEKRIKIQNAREERMKLARKIPVDILAKDFFSENQTTAETRTYLLANLLPTLILGVEKLLTEVEKRGLAEKGHDHNFNPINYLAQYLMRNNPKYSNFPEASPYIRGLQDVTEQVKKHIFSFESNKLARMKLEAKQRREDRENYERRQLEAVRVRSAKLRDHYKDWITGIDGRVDMELIQTALQSFVDISQHFPDDLRKAAVLSRSIDPADAKAKKSLSLDQFTEYLKEFVREMSMEAFEMLVEHLSQCSAAFRRAIEQEARREVLAALFTSCDHASVGVIDRKRVLRIFEDCWDEAALPIRKSIRNPRKWPVVELNEVTDESPSDASTPEPFVPTTVPSQMSSNREGDEELKEISKESQEKDATQPEPEETAAAATAADEEKPSGEQKDAAEAEEAEKPTEGEEKPANESEEKAAVEGTTEEKPAEDITEEQKPAEEEEKPAETAEEAEPPAEAAVNSEAEPPTEAAVDSEEKPTEDAAAPKPEEGEAKTEEEKQQPEDVDKPAIEEEQGQAAAGEDEEKEAEDKLLKMVATGGDDAFHTDDLRSVTPAGRTSVTFAAETYLRDKKDMRALDIVKTPTTRSASRAASAFDEFTLNLPQFVQLVELFISDEPTIEAFEMILRAVKNGYVETEVQKLDRLKKARRAAMSAKKKLVLNELFELWDNEGSGYLDLDEVDEVLIKYKENMEKILVTKAREALNKEPEDTKITKTEFKAYLENLCRLLPGEEENFDPLVEYLMLSIERSYAERQRGEVRKKWLNQVVQAAETGGASLEPVYKAVFQALYKDSETHGGNKRICAHIGILEHNFGNRDRGDMLIRYVATTPEDAKHMLNKTLYPDMKGVSFHSVKTGKPIHIPRVKTHGNVHLWNPKRVEEERDGSFIVLPLKDQTRRVFGVLGVDTLADYHTKSIFITHEISYFQGIAKAFSTAFHYVDIRRKTLRIAESAVSWIHRRSPSVYEVNVYMVEPNEEIKDFRLRQMMTTNQKGHITMHEKPIKLERIENLFRDYLFRCVDNSETVTADAYGERHTAFPLRDGEGHTVAVIDISIGTLKQLPSHENHEVQRMLKLLQAAHKEVAKESAGGEKKVVLEAEKSNESNRIDVMFDRIMLQDLRDSVSKLDLRAFAELKSYIDPPKIIHDILISVCSIFHQEEAKEEDLQDWNTCKQYLNHDLIKLVMEFDPTAENTMDIPVDSISSRLISVPQGAVAKHGSLPAQHLYNWAFVCLSLLEHTAKSRQANAPRAITPVQQAKSPTAAPPAAAAQANA